MGSTRSLKELLKPADCADRANGDDEKSPEEILASIVWSRAGESFRTADEVMPTLPAGRYQADSSMFGGVFLRGIPGESREETYFLDGGVYQQVGAEVSKFISSRQKYRENGIMHRRGILLYGPPGCGKSCIMEGVQEYVIEQGGVVLQLGSMSDNKGVLRMLAAIEPERLVMIAIDELDSFMDNHSTEEVLGLLDGTLVPNTMSVLVVATTNHLNRLEDRCYRPGRIDLVIEVPFPNEETRKSYLSSLKVVPDGEIESLVTMTEGLSLADIKEVVVSSYILGLCSAEERVKYVNRVLYNKADDAEEKELE